MTGCGRVGQNRLLDQVELHTTSCVQFDPVFRTLRKYMNRLRFRFEPKREKNRTEPDLQTLHGSRGSHQRVVVTRWWQWRAHGSRGNHQRVARTRWWSLEAAAVGHRLGWSDGGRGGQMEAGETTKDR